MNVRAKVEDRRAERRAFRAQKASEASLLAQLLASRQPSSSPRSPRSPRSTTDEGKQTDAAASCRAPPVSRGGCAGRDDPDDGGEAASRGDAWCKDHVQVMGADGMCAWPSERADGKAPQALHIVGCRCGYCGGEGGHGEGAFELAAGMVSSNACDALVALADDHMARNGGWGTPNAGRHLKYPTTDVSFLDVAAGVGEYDARRAAGGGGAGGGGDDDAVGGGAIGGVGGNGGDGGGDGADGADCTLAAAAEGAETVGAGEEVVATFVEWFRSVLLPTLRLIFGVTGDRRLYITECFVVRYSAEVY